MINHTRTWTLILCLQFPLLGRAEQFFKISAELETFGYRLGDSNSIAKAKPRIITVDCITGTNEWWIESDFFSQAAEAWQFDGTNVFCKTQLHSAKDTSESRNSAASIQVWESRDGNPLGHFGVNLPWLAFCSGIFLKREGRLIPLPAAVLRHCPDRFAYTDQTTTFNDELGLPRTLDLFTSKSLFLKSHADWDKELAFGDRYTEWEQKTVLKLQEGVLIFHYAVLESTNVLGCNFPTKFEFFQTGRQYEQDGNWFCQGIGRVKSIRPATKPASLK